MARPSFRLHTCLLWSLTLLLAVPQAVAADHATTLADTIALSTNVVVATVREFDDRAGLGTGAARTDITLDVEEVLLGREGDRELSLSFPVGVLPDGTISGSTAVPRLTKGDRYIVFLRETSGSHQLVQGRDAILRVVSFSEKDVVVDNMGHGILASRNHGFLRVRKIAESLLGRFVARASETQPGLEYHSQAKTSMEDIALATDLPQVLTYIRDMIRYGSPRRATAPASVQAGTVEVPETSTSGAGTLQAQ